MLSILSLQRENDANLFMVRVLQDSDPAQLKAKWDLLAAEIAALNDAIQDPNERWQPNDLNLAGGGDGHTFVFTVIFVPFRLSVVLSVLLATAGGITVAPGGVPTAVTNFAVAFGMASERDAIETMQTETIQSALAICAEKAPLTGEKGLALWQQLSGASQGTRFMFGIFLTPGAFPVEA